MRDVIHELLPREKPPPTELNENPIQFQSRNTYFYTFSQRLNALKTLKTFESPRHSIALEAP